MKTSAMSKVERAAITLVAAAVGIAALKSVANRAGADLRLTPIEVALVLAAGSIAVGALLKTA